MRRMLLLMALIALLQPAAGEEDMMYETLTEACVQNAGYNPGYVAYVYRNRYKMGGTKPKIMDAGRKTGVGVHFIETGILTEGEESLLSCFYGTYSEENREYMKYPRIICLKNGEVNNIRSGRPVTVQAREMMYECRRSMG
ncbi:MAG: hypothetical protein ABIH11_01150 [Candidatus Altiarchaeota archaeon]